MKKTLLTLASFLVLTSSTQAQISFAPQVTYGAGASPYSVFSADFNNDGKMDLASANYNSGNLSVLLGSGTGTFATTVNYFVGANPISVYSADFNGDGNMDLASARISANSVSVLFGSGTGTFGAATNYAVGFAPRAVFSADLNGDGKMDLATANGNSDDVSILLGNGTGTFATAVNYTVTSSPFSLFSADFNGDGKMDLATANKGSNNVSILLGSSTGTFGAAVNYGVGSFPNGIFSADFNNDGKMDLVTANDGSANISVLLGSGSGTFSTAVNYWVGSNPFAVFSSDFNGDGKMDLASANYGSNNVSVLLGSGSGTFGAATNYAAGGAPGSVFSADFNSDGKSDIATANVGLGNLSVLLNTSIYPTGNALNFDGVNDFVQIADDANLDFSSGDFTVEYWVKKKDNSSSFSNLGGVNKWNTPLSPGTNEWSLGLTETGNDNLPSFWIESGTTTYKCPATTPLILNNWYHIAAVRQGTDMKIFVNGKLENTIAIGNISINNVASRNLLIGKINVGVNAFMSIDELRIWNIARTQCEINTFKNCEIPTTAAGLIINSHFNQGFANSNNSGITTLSNVSGTANTGALSNFSLMGSVSNWAISSAVVTNYTTTANVTPTVSAVASNSIICFGDVTTLSGAGANTYTWSDGVTDAIAFTPTLTTTYTVIGTSSLTGCSNSAVNLVTVNTLPTIFVNSGAICAGQSFTIVPGGAVTYTYSNGIDVIMPTADATYSVSGTDANGCVSLTDAVSSVTVNALPTVSVNSGAICSGQSFTMVPTGAITYTYSSGSAVVTPTSNASYNVTGTDANGCISNIGAVSSVTVNTLPTLTVNSGAICTGNSFTLMPSGASTYTYSSGSSVDTPTVNASYTVTGTDVNGCISNIGAVSSVTVNTLPTLTVNSGVICSGQSFTLIPNGASTYTYSNGTDVVSLTANTNYTVTGTDANGCSGSAVSAVTVNALPTLLATTNITLLCVGQTANLTASGATSYTWSTNATTPVIAITPSTTTNYTVNGVDANGCANTANITQNVSLCTGINSQIVTPNSEIAMYPNPASSFITIEFLNFNNQPYTVEITNTLGKTVYAQKVVSSESIIKISDLSKGIYFISILNSRIKTTQKVIVE